MSTCIPFAFGVPGLNAPPNWWDTTVPASLPGKFDNRLEDPRWRGAYGQGFGTGTAEETMFRALYHTDTGGTPSLYLSWHIKYDAASSPNQDMIYVGLAANTAAQPLILQIVAYAADPVGGIVAQPAASIQAGTRNASGHFQPLSSEPDWIAETTRVWRDPTLGQWAVQMKVPMKPGAALDDNDGVDLDPALPFRMWYCYDIYTPTNAAGSPVTGSILRLHWPDTASFDVSGGQKVYPAPSSYHEYELGSATSPSCPGGVGISLGKYQVGTTNVPSSAIDINTSNTFFARPTNHTGTTVSADQIKADFAIANWGSVASPSAPWTTIRSNEGNSGAIPDGTTADASNDIRFPWSVPAGMKGEFISGAKTRHQCMFVQLHGGGLVYTNASVYRNMDFVGASRFSREAEISVVGLEPISTLERDVYLAVETINMPKKIESDKNHRRLEALHDGIVVIPDQDNLLERITEYINDYQFTHEEGDTPEALRQALDRFLPTYRVHCYHDTGEREVINEHKYAILALQSSFGYYAIHEGQLMGWSHRLRGARRLAENFYVLRVPNDGVATVTTTIEAVGGCLWWLRAFVRWILSLLGRNP